MTAKRETGEKRERMIRECSICFILRPATPHQEPVPWRTTTCTAAKKHKGH